ncbi:MAG: gliding motility-associated C-terminal domain-containing protein [Bacteroidetes bacterium]|nr:gliding motility-associated C-terminal domain-containing protein [Bacteroidota bacterium]
MQKVIHIFLFFCFIKAEAQSLSPYVINSAGRAYSIAGSIQLSDNIGEPFIQNASTGTLLISQGFLQSNFKAVSATPTLYPISYNISCAGKHDGKINLFLDYPTNFKPSITWTPTVNCTSSKCDIADSLKANTYTVTIKYTDTTGNSNPPYYIYTKVISILDINGPCNLKVYNAITPNGDGINDFLEIDNITQYPNNTVYIFNRWGGQIAAIKNYDNQSNTWPKSNGSGVVSSTYYYVIDLGDGSKAVKGWFEVIYN